MQNGAVAEVEEDQWAAWLSKRRHGGDPELLRRTLEYLAPVRDRVVAGARLAEGDTVLDVGCGDGLIGFAAAEAVGASGSVTFSDVSEQLLDRCAELAAEAGIADRCRFVRAAASDLSPVDAGSVDAVTLRSVLIYETDKAAAFTEFHRVLRPGGRLSLFEPINRFGADETDPARFMGRDLASVADLAAKVKAVYDAIQPPDTDPMLDFDERDLLRLAEVAGFAEIHLRLDADIEAPEPTPWNAFLHQSGNPRIPTFAEAMDQALTAQETARLTARLRPQVEAGHGRQPSAVAYLTARRVEAPRSDESRPRGRSDRT